MLIFYKYQQYIAGVVFACIFGLWVYAGSYNMVALNVLHQCSRSDYSRSEIRIDKLSSVQQNWVLGWLAHCKGDEITARMHWRNYISLTPDRMELLREVVGLDVEFARYAASVQPSIAEGHFWLATASQSQAEGDMSQLCRSISAYERGLQIDPENGDAWLALGRLYWQRDEVPPALGAYDQACFLSDRGYNGCLSAANAYFDSGDFRRAADRYHRASLQLPYLLSPKKGLARSLQALGEYDDARIYWEIAAESGDTEAIQALEALDTTSH